MSKEEKKNWHSVYGIFILILLVVMTLPYIDYLGYLSETVSRTPLYINFCTGWSFFGFKLFYVVMVPLMTSLLFSIKIATTLTEEKRSSFRIYYVIISLFVILGTIQNSNFHYYNVIFLPLIVILHLYTSAMAFSKLAVQLSDANNRLGFNNRPLEEMGLVYDVFDKDGNEKKLHVHNVFQGLLVTGGAGAGKSASLIDPAIFQWAMQGCSMTIYDFKGTPPVLGLNAYNSLNHMKKNPEIFNKLNQERVEKGLKPLLIPKFELVSFDYLNKTSRPNPISPKTMASSLDTKAVTTVFMKGLNKGFVKNEDFWAQAAFALAHAIIERLRRNYPEYSTIPHMIVFGLLNTKLLVEWLTGESSPFETRAIMASFSTAILNNAEGQIGGMFSSFQQPLTPLLDPALFWVLGAPYESQSDLNLNDPENPRIMSFSNNNRKSAALSPVISCLLEVVMTNINEPNKHPHAFVIDEYPTIYLDISHLPATARSNKVASLVSFQDKSQSESAYGKEASNKLISNLGTQAYGMTNLPENAKPISDMIGQSKIVEKSYSMSDDSINVSTRLSNETTLQVPDIMNQSKGHFTGKVADGDPAFFHCQFKYFDLKKEMEWSDDIDLLNYPPPIDMVHKINPELAAHMFKSIVSINYQRIITECNLILAGVIKPDKDLV